MHENVLWDILFVCVISLHPGIGHTDLDINWSDAERDLSNPGGGL